VAYSISRKMASVAALVRCSVVANQMLPISMAPSAGYTSHNESHPSAFLRRQRSDRPERLVSTPCQFRHVVAHLALRCEGAICGPHARIDSTWRVFRSPILPDGQITCRHVHPRFKKYFPSLSGQITGDVCAVPAQERGVSRPSRTLGRDAVDAGSVGAQT
jgi:hypothetical protein